MSAEFLQFRRDHVSQHSRCQTGCVGVHQEEQRIIAEQLGSQLDKRMNGVFDLPDFALRSAPVGRRVHDDSVVMIAAADLALYKFGTVIHQPADRRLG